MFSLIHRFIEKIFRNFISPREYGLRPTMTIAPNTAIAPQPIASNTAIAPQTIAPEKTPTPEIASQTVREMLAEMPMSHFIEPSSMMGFANWGPIDWSQYDDFSSRWSYQLGLDSDGTMTETFETKRYDFEKNKELNREMRFLYEVEDEDDSSKMPAFLTPDMMPVSEFVQPTSVSMSFMIEPIDWENEVDFSDHWSYNLDFNGGVGETLSITESFYMQRLDYEEGRFVTAAVTHEYDISERVEYRCNLPAIQTIAPIPATPATPATPTIAPIPATPTVAPIPATPTVAPSIVTYLDDFVTVMNDVRSEANLSQISMDDIMPTTLDQVIQENQLPVVSLAETESTF